MHRLRSIALPMLLIASVAPALAGTFEVKTPDITQGQTSFSWNSGSVRVDHGRAGLAVLCEARRMTSDHRGGQDNANGGIPEAAG